MDTYHRRKANNLCVDCGLPLPPRWGWVSCLECRKARMERQGKKTDGLYEPRPEAPKPPRKKSLDEMSIESKERHLSYGQLQTAEIVNKIRGNS